MLFDGLPVTHKWSGSRSLAFGAQTTEMGIHFQERRRFGWQHLAWWASPSLRVTTLSISVLVPCRLGSTEDSVLARQPILSTGTTSVPTGSTAWQNIVHCPPPPPPPFLCPCRVGGLHVQGHIFGAVVLHAQDPSRRLKPPSPVCTPGPSTCTAS